MNTTAMIIRNVVLRLKKIDGEWQVVWIENGKRNELNTYYGDSSKEDAIATMKEIAKEHCHNEGISPEEIKTIVK